MLTRQGAARLIDAEFRRLAAIDINFSDTTPDNPIFYRPLEFVMADKVVSTLLSKTLEQTTKFSGKPDQDADEWLKDLTTTFRMADITEAQALKIIPTFLEGPAKLWFTENLAAFESWPVFKNQFLHNYSSPTLKQLASSRLRNRLQRYNESVIEYYTDVMKLCKIIDPAMTDISKLDHLYHGFKSSLMKEVLRRAPLTPAEFLEQARQEEALDCLVNSSVHSSTTTNISAINTPTQLLPNTTNLTDTQYYPQSSNIKSTSSPPPPYPLMSLHPQPQSGSLRCYQCQKLGHIARNCRTTKNQ